MPSTADNPKAPHVPNHEMVRSIGRGSYGEIWLARSLTGTWRAVKIVDRRTFESDKAFQREFEGMAKFEPISREDLGFVDILHVGRDEAGDFFYYVMELADDHLGEACISYPSYSSHTSYAQRPRKRLRHWKPRLCDTPAVSRGQLGVGCYPHLCGPPRSLQCEP